MIGKTNAVKASGGQTVDLSKFDIYGNSISQTTANCYVVKEAGDYMIPLVFGNALKNGSTNSAAYTKNSGSYNCDFVDYNGTKVTSPYIETVSGTVASAQLSIADTDGIFTDISIIDGSPCRYLRFKVNSVPINGANGIISIKNSSGVIMWSWHIWVWANSLATVEITNASGVKYNILPVNLASKMQMVGSAPYYITNWHYQWGRPTPFICPEEYNSNTNHSSYGVLSLTKDVIAPNLQAGIQNPTTFYKVSSSYGNNWFKADYRNSSNLWDADYVSSGASDKNVKKTIYDPCPIGFKVPNGNMFTGFTLISVDEDTVRFTRYNGDFTGVEFSTSGFRYGETGDLAGCGSNIHVWTSAGYGSNNQVYFLYFSGQTLGVSYVDYKAHGFSVRPVQE